MPTIVVAPDNTEVEFPDDVSDSEILRVMRRDFGTQKASTQETKPAPSGDGFSSAAGQPESVIRAVPVGGAADSSAAENPPESGFFASAAASAAKSTLSGLAGVARIVQSGIPETATAPLDIKVRGALGSAAEALSAGAEEAFSYYEANPTSKNIGAQIGRGAGTFLAASPALGLGPAGLVAGASQMASVSYSDAYDKALKETGDPEQAKAAAQKAALKTAPELAGYIVAGKLGGVLAGKAAGALAGPIEKALWGTAGAAAANVAAGSIIRGLEGEDWKPTAESLTMDTLFAMVHGKGEYSKAVKARAAEEIASRGVDPDAMDIPLTATEIPKAPVQVKPPEVGPLPDFQTWKAQREAAGGVADEAYYNELKASEAAAAAPRVEVTPTHEASARSLGSDPVELRQQEAAAKGEPVPLTPEQIRSAKDTLQKNQEAFQKLGEATEEPAAVLEEVPEGKVTTPESKGQESTPAGQETTTQEVVEPVYRKDLRSTEPPIQLSPDEQAVFEEARTQMKRAGREGGGTSLPQILVEAGQMLYRKGVDFAEWSGEMVRQLGDTIKPHLKATWKTIADTVNSASPAGRRFKESGSAGGAQPNEVYSVFSEDVHRAKVDTKPNQDFTEADKQAVVEAYQSLQQENGQGSQRIADVMERAGLPLSGQSKGLVMQMFNEGQITGLAAGDWSLSNSRTRAWGVRRLGDVALRMEIQAGMKRSSPSPEGGALGSAGGRRKVAKAVEEVGDDMRSTKLGLVPPGTSIVHSIADAVKQVGKVLSSPGEWHDSRKAVLGWSARTQKSFGEVKRTDSFLRKALPTKEKGNAVSLFIEADGDRAKLAAWQASPDKNIARAAKDAMNLTPKEVAVAQKVKDAFQTLRARAVHYDIFDGEVPNYIPHVIDRGDGFKGIVGGSRTIKKTSRFGKERVFPTLFDAAEAGFKTKSFDIRQLLPSYIADINNAISGKMLVEDLSKGKATDGRPLVVPKTDYAKVLDKPTGKATLIFDGVPKEDSRDYRDPGDRHPALKKWTWTGKDSDGNTIISQSDLVIHPEAFKYLRSALETSAFKEWYRSDSDTILGDIPKVLARGLDTASSTAKASMLGFLSPFHQVQEATHAVFHRINPFSGLPEADPSRNPGAMDAARHGLMLLPDRFSMSHYAEGVSGTDKNIVVNLLKKVPGPTRRLAALATAYQDYLFHKYIPSLKLKTYDAMVERNKGVYSKELASGKVTESQVKYLSAKQANAAYGHLNYVDMARDPTLQHMFQMIGLAPDFLEARTRFVGQAAKGIGSKSGREQTVAVVYGAALLYGTARVLNKLLDDDYHTEDWFGVYNNGRRYALRSVPEDIEKLLTNPRAFAYGRLNPLISRPAVQAITGVNYRGEKTEFQDTLREAITSYVPISLRPIVKPSKTDRMRPESTMEQMAGAMGLQIKRVSPINEAHKLASEFMDKKGLPKDTGTYPVSKYQQLRYALEDNDRTKATAEYKTLLQGVRTEFPKLSAVEARKKLNEGFKESTMKPFTRTKQMDVEFEKSLKGRDLMNYRKAVKARTNVMNQLQGLQ